MPVYTYIIYRFIMKIIENQREINVVTRDYFEIAGTIVYIIVCIYDLFIIKFIKILIRKLGKASKRPKTITIVIKNKNKKIKHNGNNSFFFYRSLNYYL